MRKFVTGAALTGLMAVAAAPALASSHGGGIPASDKMALKKEAKTVIKDFFTQLKGELQAAMQSGGAVEAISVCNEKAPRIAANVSGKHGWDIGRTSLKLRNLDNAPDPFELKALKMFEEKRAQGANPKKLAYAEVVEQDGQPTFRLMKAIPTGEICLTCHGRDVDPEVQAKLDALYPHDSATGYDKGDIRGAFTLQKAL